MVRVPVALWDRLRRQAGLPPRYVADCGPVQRAFVLDASDRKAALCGRRSGKSTGAALWLLEGMEDRPRTRSVYVGLTASAAEEIAWTGTLERTARQYGIPLQRRVKRGQTYVRHPNGSTLWLAGCSDRSECEKFRGQAYWRVVVDEAQAYPDFLEYLVNDVFDPALMDLGGQMALCGTPSAVPQGYFWEVTAGGRQGWGRTHHWTALENPHLPDPRAYLQKKCVDQAWGTDWTTCDHPSFLREYMGRWVRDEAALVYAFHHEENSFVPVPGGTFLGLDRAGRWTFGLGVDLGWSDRSTAFVLCAADNRSGRAYVLRVWKESRVIPEDLAAICRRVREEVRAATGEPLRVIVDEGGIGGMATETLRRYGVSCEAAPKQGLKRAAQDYVGGLVRSRKLLVDRSRCGDLLLEAAKLQWAEDGREDARFVRHACDAFLYVVRALFPRTEEAAAPALAPGTPEALAAELTARKAKMMAHRQAKKTIPGRPR